MLTISRKQKFKRLQSTLMLAFLILSLAPLTITALFFLQSHKQDLQDQSHSFLTSVRDNKQQQVISYLNTQKSYVMGFVRSELAFASGGRFYGLVNAFQQLGSDLSEAKINAQKRYITGSGDKINLAINKDSDDFIGSERYRLLHKRYHEAYSEILKRADFDDILLVDIDGNVTYSNLKLDNFGTNLISGRYQANNLGSTFQQLHNQVKEQKDENATPIVMSDFSFDKNGQLYAWLAAPIIQQGYLHSYALMRLPIDGINRIISNQSNAPTTLLVGSDFLPRSLGVSKEQIEESKPIIKLALANQSNELTYLNGNNQTIIAAYAPIKTDHFHWAIVAQIPEDVAYTRIHRLELIFMAAMLIATIIVFIASHYFSRFITDPILKLAWTAEKVSAGNLDEEVINTERQDEIGRLAISFERMQRSIRDKILTIKTQNKELEKNLTVIKKQNQDLQLSDKLKDEFLATTSHELRTPLHGMIGIAESLLSGACGSVPDQQQHQLGIIINSGQRLSHLIDDLLDYHKMVYGKTEINLSAINLGHSTSLVLELSSHLIGTKGIRIINQTADDLPLVSADPQRLEQVLYNLIGNAIKYTSEGKIIISAHHIDNKLRVQVVDTGQGIPSEQLEQIFEPLSQATSNPNQFRQGAGLGLSISKQLIELMGGALYVSSQDSVGTTFSFTLPIASENEIKAAQQNQQQYHFQIPENNTPAQIENNALPDNLEGALLLVVDDEPVNLQILDSFLRIEGYRVKTANNGADAITLIETEKPELILLDVMMPGISGYEVCEELRVTYDHGQLPIIMLTALSQADDRIHGFDVGANDYLTKPFNKQELAARIRAHLSASKAEQRRTENKQLLLELQRREQVEASLLETQGRLLEQLESAPEAIICYRKDQRIRFANQTAIQLFNRSLEQLKRSNIDELIASKFLTQNKSHYCGEITIYVNDKVKTVSADILTLPEGSDIQSMIIMNVENSVSDLRIEQLETAVDALSSYAFEGDKEKLENLKLLGQEFSQIVDQATITQSEKQQLLRETVVDAMIMAMFYWTQATDKSKFDFAEQSGLWRVYLDRSTLQTRTLDKYLHLESLPKTPRWRNVLSSLDYILAHGSKETQERRELIQFRTKLKGLLTEQ